MEMKINLIIFLFLPIFLLSCSAQDLVIAEETSLIITTASVDENLLLDVGITEFEPGIPKKNDALKTGIYEEIRAAETKYLPYHLKTTLQGTGYWGAVRVIPSEKAFTDIIIKGHIKRSDGEFIKIRFSVSDSSNLHWFTRTYETQTGLTSYSKRRDRRRDPYQKVFNDFANDLQQYVNLLSQKKIKQTRQISELKFFQSMSPSVYENYLNLSEKGIISLLRLPAENDPYVGRLRKIRERDRLVVDTLNEHYANFYYGISIPYLNWRKTTRSENVKFRQEKQSAKMQALVGVIVLAGSTQINTDSSSRNTRNIKRALQYQGISRGVNTIFAAVRRSREAELHLETIAELSDSFGSEAAPMVINIEGQERRLIGTAEAQFEGWRQILHEIYKAETGFSQSLEVGAPARSPDPTG